MKSKGPPRIILHVVALAGMVGCLTLITKPILSEAENWKTYVNQKFGFELQCPDTWTWQEGIVDAPTPYVSFRPPLTTFSVEELENLSEKDAGKFEASLDPYHINIYFFQNPSHLTSKQFAEQEIKRAQASEKIIHNSIWGGTFDRASDITFNGYDAYKFEGATFLGMKMDKIYVAHGSFVYRVVFPCASPEADKDDSYYSLFHVAKNTPILNRILSTFKFIQ